MYIVGINELSLHISIKSAFPHLVKEAVEILIGYEQ